MHRCLLPHEVNTGARPRRLLREEEVDGLPQLEVGLVALAAGSVLNTVRHRTALALVRLIPIQYNPGCIPNQIVSNMDRTIPEDRHWW